MLNNNGTGEILLTFLGVIGSLLWNYVIQKRKKAFMNGHSDDIVIKDRHSTDELPLVRAEIQYTREQSSGLGHRIDMLESRLENRITRLEDNHLELSRNIGNIQINVTRIVTLLEARPQ